MGNYTHSNSDIHEFDDIHEEEKQFFPRRTKIEHVKDAPSFPIGKTAKLADSIYLGLLDHTTGSRMSPDECSRISKTICRLINYPTSKSATVYESLYPVFMAKDINASAVYQMAVRIAANIEYIRRHEVVPVWDMMVDVWAPVEVIGSETYYCRVPAKEIRIFITGGIPAGGFVTQTLSCKFLQYMMREVGYPTYKIFDSEEIYNMKFTALLGRDKSKIKMMAFHIAENQRKHNSGLYKIRHGGCPFNSEMGCTGCIMGTNRCPGSLHKMTYTVGDCSRGHQGALCDDPQGRCVRCIEKDKKDEYFKALEVRREKEKVESYGNFNRGPGETGQEQVPQHGELSQSPA
jgi:hypothetical protein